MDHFQTRSRWLGGIILACASLGWTSSPTWCQDDPLTPRTRGQLEETIAAYQHRAPQSFIQFSQTLLNRTGKSGLEDVNRDLKRRGLPTVHEMIARVRIDATKSRIPLPDVSWNEFHGMVPVVVDQISNAVQQFESHPLGHSRTPAPNSWEQYEQWIWDLHVLSNQFQVLSRVADSTENLKRRFARQITQQRDSWDEDVASKFDVDLEQQAIDLRNLLQRLGEREARVRVLRVDDAYDRILNGRAFAEQFDAAFALAFDQQFFQEFFTTAKQEKRTFRNADLNDPALPGMLQDLIATAQARHPNLFEKAKLFHVASHWWLRGRYGQGPLANGLLKSEQAITDETARFALFMPMEMPDVEQLLGNQPADARPVIRRHEFIWSLGQDGMDTQSVSGPQTAVVATLDRFY